MTDWVEWHAPYADPRSALTARLRRVQEHVERAIAHAPKGPLSLISLCAGQGNDVIEVLARHPRRHDVTATLVELDPHNVAAAHRRAVEAHLPQVDVRKADAAEVASFADALPAHVLLLCGIFGNLSDADIDRTVDAAATLCVVGATVIWTRHRRPPDRTTHIRRRFERNGFDEVDFDALDTEPFAGIGVHRLRIASPAAPPDHALFRFIR
ncbi:MAG TPA: class I SAM-dependent methyltransferase family protein [Jatrophihabitantaceae bacterium]|nr:class I SAM-dependent methyltransferase family protein [Jatrophihabitantaceae bacterium]